MATSLLALLDDIATILDDVAAMTKVAASRTAGVLGDDLALNAQQVAGVRADRELPVVWAVFKGSARNKLILVPVALGLSALVPAVIQPLLMLGGCYLCFEGFEKLANKFLHPERAAAERAKVIAAVRDPAIDLVAFEQQKIKGAIRTDFVLSAEIIVIAMGTVQQVAFTTQVLTVVAIAVLMTLGVYGLVAAIVRLDDVGEYLARTGQPGSLRTRTGRSLVGFSPYLMKTLTVVGTAAMFLVGGGILAHGIAPLHHLQDQLVTMTEVRGTAGPTLAMLASLSVSGLIGIAAGALLTPLVGAASAMIHRVRASSH